MKGRSYVMRTNLFRLLICGSVLICSPVFSAPDPMDYFPSSPVIQRQTAFWEKVFTEYKSNEFVLHDRDNLDIIICALKVPATFTDGKADRPIIAPDDEIEAYRKALRRFAVEGYTARFKGKREAQVWDAYLKNHAIKQLLSGN